jgi:hypothetical protein
MAQEFFVPAGTLIAVKLFMMISHVITLTCQTSNLVLDDVPFS